MQAGVIDPTKVTRTALQNAASIAGLLLTTEALIVEKKETAGSGAVRRPRRRRHGRDVLALAALRVRRRGSQCGSRFFVGF